VGPVIGSSTGPHAGIWIGYAPLTRATYFPPPTSWFMSGNGAFLPSFYYLGWYWALALAASALLTVVSYRRHRRTWPGRGYLAAGALLVAVALALPLLTQALPGLASVWLRAPWVKGLPALVIAGCMLGVLAWAEHSRRLAGLTLIYALVALVAGLWLASVPEDVLVFWPALNPGSSFLSPLDALLLPAAVLIAGGLAARRPGRLPGWHRPGWRGRQAGRGRLPA
jgi:hypothetical protein